MNSEEVRAIFRDIGAAIEGTHVVYETEEHGSAYIDMKKIYARPRKVRVLCGGLARLYADEWPDIVVGPGASGAILAMFTALHLSRMVRNEVAVVYSEMSGDEFVLSDEYDKLVHNRRVLVVADVLTTGATAKRTANVVERCGGTVMGVAALWNRGGVNESRIGLPMVRSLVNIRLDSWNEASCPLCEQGIPMNPDVGLGVAFIARTREKFRHKRK
ncbi:MAG: hypothetical protein RL681_401 [Candidatus Parcubacteria bacterium]|jgi:orotate phosphoribosyltransferase